MTDVSFKLTTIDIVKGVINRVYSYPALRRGEKIGASPRFTINCTADDPDKGVAGRLRLELYRELIRMRKYF